MTFRCLALGTALLTLATTPALAQQSGVNFVGGFVSSTVKLSGVEGDIGSRSGFAAGLSITRGFGAGLEFTPELLYAQKGAKETDDEFTSTLELTYVQLPLLLRKTLGEGSSVRPFIIAGPSIGYLIDCKQSVSEGGFTETADCDSEGTNELDFGVMGGIGVAMARVSISVRYDMGFANVADAEDDDSLKNRALMVMVGVKF